MTQTPAAIGSKSVVLAGTVNPHGRDTVAWFEWGVDNVKDNNGPIFTLGAGSDDIPLQQKVDNINPGTTYRYRLAARNDLDILAVGDIMVFTPPPIPPPTVSTAAPVLVTSNTCTLNGTVIPNGYATSAWFEWGADANYGSSTPHQSLGDGVQEFSYSQPLDKLSMATSYHYRAVAQSEGGVAAGEDMICRTDSAIVLGTGSSIADADGDGLNDNDEVNVYGTNPLKADTDRDGLDDGDEVNTHHTDPLAADTDGDGLYDGAEITSHHSDPVKSDTDGDGLTDGDEIDKFHTDPLKSDSDSDGLTDPDEMNLHHTDPTTADSDGDNLSDYQEIFTYSTNPNGADSDNDGLFDGEEVNTYRTDPLGVDSDADGLNDFQELKIYGTDPHVIDTDGDGVSDGKEVQMGTNPAVYDAAFYPDLTISLVTGPLSANTGRQIDVTATAQNGDLLSFSAAFDVGIYLSIDNVIDTGDTHLGSQRVMGGMLAGQSDAVFIAVSIPSGIVPGVYFLGALADIADEVQESDETNNISTTMITVSVDAAGDGADGTLSISGTFSIASSSSNVFGNAADRNGGYADGFSAQLTADVTAGATALAVSSSAGFVAGDEVLVIQMRHDAGPSNAGTYEFAYVSAIPSATGLTLSSGLAFGYYGTTGKAQVVRVPHYQDVTVNSGATLTAAAYNDSIGSYGIVAFRISGTLTVDGTITAAGLGFGGGPRVIYTAYPITTGNNGDSYKKAATTPTYDGRSVSSITNAANDGGGAGGGNAGTYAVGTPGGGGGYGTAGQDAAGTKISTTVNAKGGSTYGPADLSKLFLGSGGGSGSSENNSKYSGAGGNGGGIIYIGARTVSLTGAISANGATGGNSSTGASPGGGGAGGSIYLRQTAATGINSALVTAEGGAGGCLSYYGCNTYGGNGGSGRIVVKENVPVDLTVAALSGPASATVGDAITINNTIANAGDNIVGPSEAGLYLVPQQADNFLSFGGVDDYVSVPRSSTLTFANTSAFTVEVWFMFPTAGDLPSARAQNAGLFQQCDSGGACDSGKTPVGRIWLAVDQSNHLFSYIGNASTAGSTAITHGTWYHAAVVYDSGTVTVYLNGEQEATAGRTLENSTGNYVIGSGKFTAYTKGNIDDVAVYNAALTAADIGSHYNGGAGVILSGSEAGLVAYWPFNEGSGSTTTADLTANANTGYLADNTFLTFDGINDYVSVADNAALDFSLTQGFSVEAWVKTSTGAANGTIQRILAKARNSTSTPNYNLRLDGNGTKAVAKFVINDSTNVPVAAGTTNIADGKWHHIVGVRDTGADTLSIYVDGILDGTAATDTTTASIENDGALNIGRFSGGGFTGHYFNGAIDQVAIYNVALTTTDVSSRYQVSSHYNGGAGLTLTGSEAGLVGYWPFDEGSGGVTADLTSNANPGTVWGPTWTSVPPPAWASRPEPDWDAAILLATRGMALVGPASSSVAATAVTIPGTVAPGTYYLGARTDIADTVAESNETNNQSAGAAITITAAGGGVLSALGLSSSGGGGALGWTDLLLGLFAVLLVGHPARRRRCIALAVRV